MTRVPLEIDEVAREELSEEVAFKSSPERRGASHVRVRGSSRWKGHRWECAERGHGP